MDATTEKLTGIFKIVNDWLKFAEAKNAVLLAFSGAGFTSIRIYLTADENLPKCLQVILILAMISISLSSLMCSLSFLPNTNLKRVLRLLDNPDTKEKNKIDEQDNLYFFKDLHRMSGIHP